MTRSTAIGVAALAAVLIAGVVLQWRSRDHVTEAGFWFDEGVTFELPHLQAAGFRDPIVAGEQRTIRALARAELQEAFSDFRLAVSDDHGAPYTVSVVQEFPASRLTPFGAAGQSIVLAPLGGRGSVSFQILGSLAVTQAPPGATRQQIIEGIGRGIGRAAAHEFAHQLLPNVQIDASTDDRSYEFEAAARPAEFYGSMHWDLARTFLERRLGRR